MGISCFLGYFDNLFPKIFEKFNFFSFLDYILLILLNVFWGNFLHIFEITKLDKKPLMVSFQNGRFKSLNIDLHSQNACKA